MAEISEYSIVNAVTNNAIQIYGKLDGTPYKLRYNKKITLGKNIRLQHAGMMYKGTFSVDFLDEDNYNLLYNAWKNGHNLFINECNGNRLMLSIVDEELGVKPNPNNTDKSVYYTGQFNIEGAYDEDDKI